MKKHIKADVEKSQWREEGAELKIRISVFLQGVI